MEEQLPTAETVQPEPEVIEEHVEPVADDQPIVESETKAETEESLFNDDTEIVLGEDKQPVKLSELKSGYLRQSDYTKKTQTLAEERKEFEAKLQEYEPVKGWLDYINQNPYLFKQVNEFINHWNNQGEPLPLEEVLDSEAGPYINHLLSRVSELETELNRVSGEYQETKFGTEMNAVLSDLKAEFKDLVTPEYEQSLKEQAKEQKLSADVIKRIAKGDLADMKLKQLDTKKIEAETIKKIQQNAATSTGSLAQEGADHKVGYTQMSEAQKKALRERVLRGENVQL